MAAEEWEFCEWEEEVMVCGRVWGLGWCLYLFIPYYCFKMRIFREGRARIVN